MMTLNPISRQREQGIFQRHGCSGKAMLDRMQRSAEEKRQPCGNHVNDGIYEEHLTRARKERTKITAEVTLVASSCGLGEPL